MALKYCATKEKKQLTGIFGVIQTVVILNSVFHRIVKPLREFPILVFFEDLVMSFGINFIRFNNPTLSGSYM